MPKQNRKFEFKIGASVIFTAYAYSNNNLYENILSNLEGWDDFDGVNITTEAKLTGIGSYILNKQINERKVTLTVNLYTGNEQTVEAVFASVKTFMLAMDTMTMDYIKYGNDGVSEASRERLQGIITAVKWDRLDDSANMSITLLCNEPLKDIYYNGSTTSGGKIL